MFERRQADVSVVQQLKQRLRMLFVTFIFEFEVYIVAAEGSTWIGLCPPGAEEGGQWEIGSGVLPVKPVSE
jgi:hypothetical protein